MGFWLAYTDVQPADQKPTSAAAGSTNGGH